MSCADAPTGSPNNDQQTRKGRARFHRSDGILRTHPQSGKKLRQAMEVTLSHVRLHIP
jgi:hypothetical protein